MNKLILLLLVAGCSQPVSLSPELYATSWHSRDKPSGESYNQRNPGLGVAIKRPVSEHWQAGGRVADYRNSLNKNSAYGAALAEYHIGDESALHGYVGAQAGIVSGYNASVEPLAMPVVGLGYNRVTINLTAFPIANGHGVAVSGWLSVKMWEF